MSSSSQLSSEVFLSFRGEDTRYGFTAHLYDALRRRGINAYIDNEDLKRGQFISPALLTAIENSMFSVVVLSQDYASSRWCLEELVKIWERLNAGKLNVLPIFYKVDPSDVRNQRGSFGKAFAKHEKNSKERVPIWREALTQIANLSGWDSRNRDEPSLIKEVVDDIFNRLIAISSSGAGDLVGIDCHLKEIESLLSIGSNDVRIIGIWGMGGIGKTTIANIVYEKISKLFEGCCFLRNVREVSKKHGLVELQRQLLSELLEEGRLRISTTEIGYTMKTRLRFKRVLIVLDDVHELQQLEHLAGKHNWFSPGSRIIVTTRDVHLLNNLGVNGIYEVKKINHNDALKLFSWHAFKQDYPTKDYMELSNYAVSYARGLPLALKVLGSFLFNKNKLEWKEKLDKLKTNPCLDIQTVLQISFDGLDDTEQDIFLDIACFFKGEDKDYVIKILDSCGFYPNIGISVLMDKSLITIIDNKLWMHDLLQEMGWDIVRRAPHKNPYGHMLDAGMRSRLWLQEDVYEMLTQKTGTENVEGIFLNLSGLNEISFTTEAFINMKKLRLLKVYNFQYFKGFESGCKSKIFSQDFQFPSNGIRYLYWEGFPSKSLPSTFQPKNLVELNLCYSNVEELWKGTKNIEKLEFLELSHSRCLVKTPDFSGVPNLERLILEGCTRLHEVHHSLGVLNKLILLNLKDCKNLQYFPSTVELPSLRTFILSGCSKLKKFPEIIGYMKDLAELCLDGTAITQLPSSIKYATGLVVLDLKNCKKLRSLPSSICKLKSMDSLFLSHCSKFEEFPDIQENMEGLRRVFLDGTAIKELPSSIQHLNGLVLLNLRNCKNLIALPSSICNLKYLNTLILSGCSKLEKLPQNLGDLESLVELKADGTAIRKPPSSIVLLKNLMVLSFHGSKWPSSYSWNSLFWSILLPSRSPDSVHFLMPPLAGLHSLAELDLSDCNIVELPSDIDSLSSLIHLKLSRNKFSSLPASISGLPQLKIIELESCKKLQALPELPSSIKAIDAHDCASLETFSYPLVYTPQSSFRFTNCFKLKQHRNIVAATLLNILLVAIKTQNLEQYFWSTCEFSTFLPGGEIPEWFSHQGTGSSVTVPLPPDWFNSNFLGFAVCVNFIVKDVIHRSPGNIFCELKSDDLHSHKVGYFSNSINWGDEDRFVKSDHLWLSFQPRFRIELDDFDWPNKLKNIEASFDIDGIHHQIKTCGVRLVYTEDLNDIMPIIIQDSSCRKSSSVLNEEFDTPKPENRDGYCNNNGEDSASGSENKDSSICNEVEKEERKPHAMESNLMISNCWNATSVFGLMLLILGMGILGCLAMIGYPNFLKCE